MPQEQIYASDLRRDFFDLGYELFADRETMNCEFIVSDIFDDNSELAQKLAGNIDVVNAASFFHLFSWDKQVEAVKRVIALLRPRAGSILIGRQAGQNSPKDPSDKENSPKNYRHDIDSWKRLWEQVGRETGTQWQVDAWKEEWQGLDKGFDKWHEDVQSFKLRFVVRRV